MQIFQMLQTLLKECRLHWLSHDHQRDLYRYFYRQLSHDKRMPTTTTSFQGCMQMKTLNVDYAAICLIWKSSLVPQTHKKRGETPESTHVM